MKQNFKYLRQIINQQAGYGEVTQWINKIKTKTETRKVLYHGQLYFKGQKLRQCKQLWRRKKKKKNLWNVNLLQRRQDKLQRQGNKSCTPRNAENSKILIVENQVHKAIIFWIDNVPGVTV